MRELSILLFRFCHRLVHDQQYYLLLETMKPNCVAKELTPPRGLVYRHQQLTKVSDQARPIATSDAGVVEHCSNRHHDFLSGKNPLDLEPPGSYKGNLNR
jgi:hypothetical protein